MPCWSLLNQPSFPRRFSTGSKWTAVICADRQIPLHPSRLQTLFKSSNNLSTDCVGQHHSKAQPIKQTLAELDPFAQSAGVKKLTR